MIEYPKWLYSFSDNPVIVQSKEEGDALGAGWFESPADVAEPKVAIKTAKKATVVDEKV